MTKAETAIIEALCEYSFTSKAKLGKALEIALDCINSLESHTSCQACERNDEDVPKALQEIEKVFE